ncbi:MAG: hypothetical protein Q8P31_07820 [Bacillota bacterium]|nr:hypothetical protein [Bacillota bacterium]
MRDWPELVDALGVLARGDRVLEAGTGRGAMLEYLLRLLSMRRAAEPWLGIPSLVTLAADPAARSLGQGPLPAAARRCRPIGHSRGGRAYRVRGWSVPAL